MRVMRIGHMGMRVPPGFVPVPVAVFAGRQRIVTVLVMPIVVAVGMLVPQRLMRMLVAV